MSDNAPTRAAGYVRVSQERNARNGYGLDAQESDIRRYAEYKGLRSAGVYREAVDLEPAHGSSFPLPSRVRLL